MLSSPIAASSILDDNHDRLLSRHHHHHHYHHHVGDGNGGIVISAKIRRGTKMNFQGNSIIATFPGLPFAI